MGRHLLNLTAAIVLAGPLLTPAQVREQVQTTVVPPTQTSAPVAQSLELPDPLSTSITGARASLGPGDLIEIAVFDTPELTQRVRVTSDGKIRLALIGDIDVSGMSSESLRSLIEKDLIEGRFVKNPQVSIFVAEYAGQLAYVVGEVNRPGAYPLLRSHHLQDLISAAGGPSARAGNWVTITRGVENPEVLNVNLARKDAKDNPEILAGDRISVGETGIVYVLGEVGKPGGFLIDRHKSITVLQALALAEGIQPSASIKKATLIRNSDELNLPVPEDPSSPMQMPGTVQISLSIEKILKAENADITVEPGDIIYVYGSLTRGLGRSALLTLLGTASTATIYVAALH